MVAAEDMTAISEKTNPSTSEWAKDSTTDRLRVWNMVLFSVLVLGGVGGWLLGKDPNQLAVLLGAVTAALGIGEASARTKTVTYSKERTDATRQAQAPAGS